MRLVFAGTPEIAAVSLKVLLEKAKQANPPWEIIAVYTQPDRPQGRGQHLAASPVKQLALTENLPIQTPLSLKSPEAIEILKQYQPDLMIVCAYGLILPQAILDIPIHGCWNIHVSLLPRWRGAAPIQRAIEAGDTETGICIMQMDAGLDTGDILLSQRCAISPTDTSQILHDRLAQLGAETLLNALDAFSKRLLHPTPQSTHGITYAKKLDKSESPIDWSLDAKIIHAKIRAFNPFPIATTQIANQTLRIHAAELVTDPTHPPHRQPKPGTLLEISAEQLLIQSGKGILSLTELQLPGGKKLPWKVLYNGHPNLFKNGDCLDSPL